MIFDHPPHTDTNEPVRWSVILRLTSAEAGFIVFDAPDLMKKTVGFHGSQLLSPLPDPPPIHYGHSYYRKFIRTEKKIKELSLYININYLYEW
jgi:hypothetical protein